MASAHPLRIALADGDELLNTAAVCEMLGIAAGSLDAHLAKRHTAAHPFPDPEPDPVALIVTDPAQAEAVRTLLRMTGNRRAGGVPMVWRASQISEWDRTRLRRRS